MNKYSGTANSMNEKSDDNNTHDLDILSASYRLVADVGAFDDMLSAWDRRLSADVPADEETRSMARLSNYLGDIAHLIDTAIIKTVPEPTNETDRPEFVVNQIGRILTATQSAREKFALTEDDETDFAWINPESTEDLEDMRKGCADKDNPKHAIIRITDEAGSTYLAEVFHIAAPDRPKLKLGVRVLDLLWSDDASHILRRKFALTDSEIDIARLLLETCDTAQIAERRSASIRTVRTQLASVFQKTGTQTQVDLVRLLAVLCSRIEDRASTRIAPWVDPFGNERTFSVSRGKTLAFSETGDKSGTPILLLHGPGISYALPRSAQAILTKGGIRLIALSRPGYGNSTRDTEGGQAASIVRATLALMDHLGLERAHMAGVNNGSVALMELCIAHPQRVQSLQIICGLLPRETRADSADIPLAQRALFNLRRASTRATELVARAGLKAIQAHGIDWFLARAYAESPTDQASLENKTIRALTRTGIEMMTAQSYHAFVDDLDLALHPWARLVGDITQPVHIMHGADDQLCSTDALRSIWADNANCTITEIEGAAELIYHQAADDFARHLCSLKA